MQNRRNYYRILQVQPDAPVEVIKSTYRTLLQRLKMHPDLGGDHWNASLINEAYAVLSNPEKRAHYDHSLAQQYLGHEKLLGSKIRCSCAFCKTPFTEPQTLKAPLLLANPNPQANLICTECHSPLFWPEQHDTDRYFERIPKGGAIACYIQWPAKPYSAEIEDLSPAGIRLVVECALYPENIVKLSNPLLEATAKVVHASSISEKAGYFRAGLTFLTVAFQNKRGTFLELRV